MENNIFVYTYEDFITAAIEGYGKDLKEGLEEYLARGKLKDRVDFSPIMIESGGPNLHLFLVGNIYEPDVCTMSACQYIKRHNPDTSIVCSGIGRTALELVKDFSSIAIAIPYKPSEKLIVEILSDQSPLRNLYATSKHLGSKLQKAVFREGLKAMQTRYRAPQN